MSNVTPVPVSPGQLSVSRHRQGIALLGMSTAYLLSTADRQLLAILQEPIARDLQLTDTMLGFLSLAFAIAYAFASFPLAALADRGLIRPVIAGTFAAWSALTVACGMATSFLTLLFARSGVAIGEAGCTPASHALISRSFPANSRASAMSLLMVAGILGSALAYGAGGWLAQQYGWRAAFYTLGGVGLLLSPLVWLAVGRQPKLEHTDAPEAAKMPIWPVAKMFWQNRPLRLLTILGALSSFAGYGMGQWMGSMLIRIHGLSIAEAGQWLFWSAMIAGVSGAFLGGFATDLLARRSRRAYATTPALLLVAATPCAALAALTSQPHIAIIAFAATQFACLFISAPVFAVVQSFAAPRERATAAAFIILMFNLVGMGAGPLTVGMASDVLDAMGVGAALQYAMLLGAAAMLVAAICGFLSAGDLGRALSKADGGETRDG